jgi:hypothetical protein
MRIDSALLEFKAEVVGWALLRRLPGRSVSRERIVAMLAQGDSLHEVYGRLAEEHGGFLPTVMAWARRLLRGI